LVSTDKLVDIVEKTGRSGPLLFLTTERTYTNQRGEVAVVRRSTTIWRAEAEIAGGHDE
jgi:hydroxyacyl-ACP dehydratase HTD2-like protein with hotdog domain